MPATGLTFGSLEVVIRKEHGRTFITLLSVTERDRLLWMDLSEEQAASLAKAIAKNEDA